MLTTMMIYTMQAQGMFSQVLASLPPAALPAAAAAAAQPGEPQRGQGSSAVTKLVFLQVCCRNNTRMLAMNACHVVATTHECLPCCRNNTRMLAMSQQHTNACHDVMMMVVMMTMVMTQAFNVESSSVAEKCEDS